MIPTMDINLTTDINNNHHHNNHHRNLAADIGYVFVFIIPRDLITPFHWSIQYRSVTRLLVLSDYHNINWITIPSLEP